MTTNASDESDLLPRYDAGHAPDPEAWLAMDESERLIAVLLHHEEHAPHSAAPSPDAHAAMHVAVETQIASGAPPVTAATLKRLVAEGLSRHDAVHAVAGALSRMIFEMSQRMAPFDLVAYERDLAQITAAGWLASTSDPARDHAKAQPRSRHPQRRRRARR